MLREFKGLLHGVQHPAKNDLASSQGAVSSLEFLDGGCFLSLVLPFRGLCKYLVDGVENVPSECFAAPFGSLHYANEVVDEDISVG